MVAERRECAIERSLRTFDRRPVFQRAGDRRLGFGARTGVAATPPNANRARPTRPAPSRSIANAAATVLMSSSRRLAIL